MLSRRHIRTKIVQSVYAFSISQGNNVQVQIDFFLQSINDCFKLYAYYLSLFQSLYEHAQEQVMIIAQNVKRPHIDFSYYTSFLQNPYIAYLAKHPLVIKSYKTNEKNEQDKERKLINTIFSALFASQFFQEYCQSKSLEKTHHKEMLSNLFKKIIIPSDYLWQIVKDKQLGWQDDFPLVNTYLLRQLEKLNISHLGGLSLPQTFKFEQEIRFGKDLLDNTLCHNGAIEQILVGKTPNWELNRIIRLDAAIIKTAIAELLYCTEIPVKVTLNEYLEIAKEYSTPQSNSFINGVLDNMAKHFIAGRTIKKTVETKQ